MPYGYLGVKPNQKVKNAGILDVTDTAILNKDGHLGGSMELIQTQSVSSAVAQVDFTSIKESRYSAHMLQLNRFSSVSGTNYLNLRLSNDGGSSYEEGTGYEYAMRYLGANNSHGESKSTGTDRFTILAHKDSTNIYQTNIYLYNLGDSSKYSFITNASPLGVDGSYAWGYFGGGCYDVAETINALRVFNSTGVNFTQGTATLFGIKDTT